MFFLETQRPITGRRRERSTTVRTQSTTSPYYFHFVISTIMSYFKEYQTHICYYLANLPHCVSHRTSTIRPYCGYRSECHFFSLTTSCFVFCFFLLPTASTLRPSRNFSSPSSSSSSSRLRLRFAGACLRLLTINTIVVTK